MVLEQPNRGMVARTGVPGALVFQKECSKSWMDDEQTNRFGLTVGCVTAWWNGRTDCGRKCVQAKNNSHWAIAYP